MDTDRDKIDVSDDNILLQLLLEKHDISAKQLAGWIGRATSTIYKYLSGELTIPSVIWRAILKNTGDIAVFNIITGDLPYAIAPLWQIMIPPDAATLQKLLETRLDEINCEKYIIQILQDGKVGRSDDVVIGKYKEAFPKMVSSHSQIYQAILHEYSKIGVKK